MTKMLFKLYVIGLLGLLSASCNKILEVTPRQSIDSRIALESPEAIEAALNSVFAYLRQSSQYGRDLIAFPELLSDNADHTNNPNELYGQYRNQPGANIDNWASSYAAINEINNILKVLETPVQGVNQSFKESISGQAYFLRALIYHNLMRVYAYDPTAIVEVVNYGGVPILTDPVLQLEDITYPSRPAIEDVYALIYKDLDSAYNLLEGKSIGENNPDYYPSSTAAAGLFTRVALYNGDYERVVSEAEKVLAVAAGKLQTTPANYISSWRSVKNPESLFELVYLTPDNIGVNESLRVTFTSRATLGSSTFNGRGNVVVSDDLYNSYSPDDARRQLIINGVGRNANRKEMTKFISKNGQTNLDNVPVLRIPEVYLNRAEAYVRMSPAREDLARIDLNTIRERVGLGPVSSSLSGQALLDEILLQNRLEFAFEGHRFYDLKRLGMDIIKPIGNVPFEDYRMLSRIPVTERQRNSNIKQNFGYEN